MLCVERRRWGMRHTKLRWVLYVSRCMWTAIRWFVCLGSDFRVCFVIYLLLVAYRWHVERSECSLSVYHVFIVSYRYIAIYLCCYIALIDYLEILMKKDTGFNFKSCYWRKGLLSKLKEVEINSLYIIGSLAFSAHGLWIQCMLATRGVFLDFCRFFWGLWKNLAIQEGEGSNYISIKLEVFSSWRLRGIKIFIICDCIWKCICN